MSTNGRYKDTHTHKMQRFQKIEIKKYIGLKVVIFRFLLWSLFKSLGGAEQVEKATAHFQQLNPSHQKLQSRGQQAGGASLAWQGCVDAHSTSPFTKHFHRRS